ncbi:MAG TPA: PepSY domain-containing protein [Candidatus Polarisedimenticolia bacterium]|nr:PepSY domain-containing protein [Candidatus Polarisedimenticolia bacterium]
MSKKSIWWGAGLLLMAACAFPTNAAPPPRLERMLERLPAPVKQTIRAQVADGKLSAIDRDNEDGRVSYDVEMVRAGRTRSFTVSDEGELIDTEVFLNELPPAVREAIRKKVGGATLGEIDRSVDGDGTSYEVEVLGGGTNRSFTVDANGKLTDEDVFLSELPADFQAGIRKEAGGGTIDGITRSFDDDGASYDVDLVENGRRRTLTFDAKGTLLGKEEEIALSDAPEPVQKEIQTHLAGGKLVAVSRVTETGLVSFDFDIRQRGKVKSYTVGEDGRLISSEGK